MAEKPKKEKPARPRDPADDKKPRGKPVSLFPLTFDEAMKRLVRPPRSPDLVVNSENKATKDRAGKGE